MEIEVFEAIGVKIHVEIFDEDMRETIWPMSDEHNDEGLWLLKERADQMTDYQIGSYFLKRFLIDYGNSYTYTVTRGEEEIRKFRRKIKM